MIAPADTSQQPEFQRDLDPSTTTGQSNMAQPPPAKSASYKSNLDPMAVLKRVEDLRKWQEEEKLKLLQAHEDQMQQFRVEQVRLLTTLF